MNLLNSNSEVRSDKFVHNISKITKNCNKELETNETERKMLHYIKYIHAPQKKKKCWNDIQKDRSHSLINACLAIKYVLSNKANFYFSSLFRDIKFTINLN